jgi:hypothetical protein
MSSPPPGDPVEVHLEFRSGDDVIDVVSYVLPLGDRHFSMEDPWIAHPLSCAQTDNDQPPGGLAYQDVFLAQPLANGALRFEAIVRRGDWRVENFMLGPALTTPYLEPVFKKIVEHGGFAEEDPWIGGGWWVFMPPGSDYDPDSDFIQAVKTIPRDELVNNYRASLQRAGLSGRQLDTAVEGFLASLM